MAGFILYQEQTNMSTREFWQGHSVEQTRESLRQSGLQRQYSRYMKKEPLVLPTVENQGSADSLAMSEYPGSFTPNKVPGVARDATNILPTEGPGGGTGNATAPIPVRSKRKE